MNGAPVDQNTEAKLLWDDKFLYVAFEIADADIWSSLTKRDDKLWTQEADRADGGRRQERQDLRRAAGGAERQRVRHAICPRIASTRTASIPRRRPFSWNSKVNVKVNVDGTLNKHDDKDKGWTVELALPSDGCEGDGAQGGPVARFLRSWVTPGASTCFAWTYRRASRSRRWDGRRRWWATSTRWIVLAIWCLATTRGTHGTGRPGRDHGQGGEGEADKGRGNGNGNGDPRGVLAADGASDKKAGDTAGDKKAGRAKRKGGGHIVAARQGHPIARSLLSNGAVLAAPVRLAVRCGCRCRC